MTIAIAAVAVLAAACGSGDIVATSTPPPTTDLAAQLDALASARQLWAAAPADYTVSVGDETLAVRSGEIVSLASAEAPTVEDVYTTIEESIRSGAVVEVEYDAELGYPTRVVIDLDGDGIADVDLTFGDLEAMPIVENLAQLLDARARWESQDLTTYRYIFRADCTCDEGGTFDVEVRDGRIVGLVPLDEAAASTQLTPTTMREAFDDLEDWFTNSAELIDEGILAVDVRMDPELGYPRWFHVEGADIDEGPFAEPFTIVVTIDLVLPYEPIDGGPDDGAISAEDKRALEVAQLRWAAAALKDYRYQLTFHCLCPLEESGPFVITVRDGEVSIVGPGDGSGPIPDKVLIDDFFETIDVTINAGTDVDVTYDDMFGYPTLAIIDTDAVAVDGGLAFSISDFEEITELGLLFGNVFAGPQCPVQQDPPAPGCEDQPVAKVEILITSEEPGRAPVSAFTGRDGEFFIDLRPGVYVVTAPDLDEYLGTPEPVTVTITAGGQEEVLLYYDTGIR